MRGPYTLSFFGGPVDGLVAEGVPRAEQLAYVTYDADMECIHLDFDAWNAGLDAVVYHRDEFDEQAKKAKYVLADMDLGPYIVEYEEAFA